MRIWSIVLWTLAWKEGVCNAGSIGVSAPSDVVAVPLFSPDHGFYDDPFTLTLSCDTPGATIRYTTDGQPPTETTGAVYTVGIAIRTTTCVRAAAFQAGRQSSPVQTRTFIFLADVARQPKQPPGFPGTWSTVPADYEMDPDVVDGLAPGQLAQALRSLPTMSIVMKVDDLFGTAGIYSNWSHSGDAWERPGSVELILPDGSAGFQVNCGIRLHGGAGRREAKKSFRLQFTSAYGPGKLHYPLFGPEATDRFDQLVLRAGFNDAYPFVLGAERAQFIRDEFARRLQLALGEVSPHGKIVHLYINGLYWGLYNPTERPDASFAAAYYGGDREDWDALHDGWPTGTSTTATWDAMLYLVRQGMMSNTNYQRLQGNDPGGARNPQVVKYLDLDNYIRYLLMNFFIGNHDWPGSNWYAAMNRAAPTGWKSFSWDAEHSLGVDSPLTIDVTDIDHSLGEPYAWLRSNPDFCLRFADAACQAFFPGGPLYVDSVQPGLDRQHPERNRPAALYALLADGVEPAVLGESARWGDVTSSSLRIDHWRHERDWVLHTYLPRRSAIVLSQLRRAGLYPTIDPPAFQIDGAPALRGMIPSSSLLTMTTSTGATIYYTTDGSDPRTPAFSTSDVQMVALVPASAPKRVLVPSVANGGNSLKNFSGGFEVTYYEAIGLVDSLVAAEAVIADANLRISTLQEQVRVINYGAGGPAGHFTADRFFPGTTTQAEADDFVIVATGTVQIPTPGNWTFGVRSAGGFGLTLSKRGKAYTCSSPGPGSTSDTLAVFNVTDSALYDLRLVFYGPGEGAELELSAAPGSFTSFSAAEFRLVGDILQEHLAGQDSRLWFASSFEDSSWRPGAGDVGYGQGSGSATPSPIDVGADMYQVNGSCYIRIPFMVASASYASLRLQMRCDGGFLAYLNGIEVARRNFAGDPQWDSVASAEADGGQSVIDISTFAGLLRPGANLLAIHGLNDALDSSDFLISAELVADRLSQGSASPAALPYTGPLPVTQSVHLKARAFNGQWSALNEVVLAVGPVAQSLRVSELMYHPLDTGNPRDPNAEFVELTNIGSQSVNLHLVQFTKGIHCIFPSSDLPAGGYCLVVKDLVAFQGKYGTQLPVVGQYTGSLDNSGERIELVDAVGTVIQDFEYNDKWFKITDGQGYSLTVRDPRAPDPNSFDNENAWRPSTSVGGSPGRAD